MRFRLLTELKEIMNPTNFSLQPVLLSTLRRLKILRRNLSHWPTQPENLSEMNQQLSQIKSELQKVLSTLSQPRDELIDLLSHEFLTPLTSLQGALQLLAVGRFNSGSIEVQLLLNLAFKHIDKLIRIFRELLTYEQIKSGQLQIVPQQCLAADLVKQAAQVIRLKGTQIGVILLFKPVFVSVWAEPHLTILLISHLLSNAVKFSSTGSIVTLTARQSKEFVLFQIKDRGIGIASEQLEKIFDCFYQVDSSDSRPYNGLGLGLALCRSIVALHGGRLWAERNLRGGSIFYFTLPVYRPARYWWVKIQTKKPQCIYYFGPFESAESARGSQEGYLEDLRLEGARGITVQIKQCQPEHLTICSSAEMELEPEQPLSRKN